MKRFLARAGQPPGLVTLAGTELFERISFHGMLAMLVLYLANRLLLAPHVDAIWGFAGFRAGLEVFTGPLSITALAAQIFGLYIGFCYLAPVLGGMIGDRITGRRQAVALGCVLMSLGHLCMAFDATFLLALLLLILGAGLLRGNLLAQLDLLYTDSDPRQGEGFQIYYSMVNTGGFIAPFLTGTAAKYFGWHVGFGLAGIGMLVALVIYFSGQNQLTPVRTRADTAAVALTGHDRRRLAALIFLLLPLTCFWIGGSQTWNCYNLWAQDNVDLTISGFVVPVPWLVGIDALAAVVLVPPVIAVWRWCTARGIALDEINKLWAGCLLASLGYLWPGLGDLLRGAAGKVPLYWDMLYHIANSVGYLNVQPVALALFARAAPRGWGSTLVGVYFLTIFAGSLISGRLGALYDHWTPLAFWGLHGAICALGGLLILLTSRWLRHALRSQELG